MGGNDSFRTDLKSLLYPTTIFYAGARRKKKDREAIGASWKRRIKAMLFFDWHFPISNNKLRLQVCTGVFQVLGRVILEKGLIPTRAHRRGHLPSFHDGHTGRLSKLRRERRVCMPKRRGKPENAVGILTSRPLRCEVVDVVVGQHVRAEKERES